MITGQALSEDLLAAAHSVGEEEDEDEDVAAERHAASAAATNTDDPEATAEHVRNLVSLVCHHHEPLKKDKKAWKKGAFN